MGRDSRRRIEPTDDWELLLPLFSWPEQRNYEELRLVTLFGCLRGAEGEGDRHLGESSAPAGSRL